MNLFGVCVLICGITVSIGQMVNNQQNNGYAFQMNPYQVRDSSGRYRLMNFPTPSQYQNYVIDYPGSFPAQSQNPNAHVPNGRLINGQYYYYPQMQRFVQMKTLQQMANTIPSVTTVSSAPIAPTITTTTTPQPEIVSEPIEEQAAPLPVPAVRTPARRIRIRPVSPPIAQQPVNQIQGKDINEGDSLPNDSEFDGKKDESEEMAKNKESEKERLLREEQAKSAYYTFGTSVDDTINDHGITREETREGLALRGKYSYRDGFFERTIHYEADENGYRVVKEEIVPIGNGPEYNPDGRADVTQNLHNNQLSYSITAKDFVREKKNKTAIPNDRTTFA